MRVRNHQQLYGLTMRPCSISQKENEKVIHSSKYAARSNYKKQYETNIAANQILAESAKIYILKNWKKVKSWKDLEISIIDNTGKETYYYSYKKIESIRSRKVIPVSNKLEKLKSIIKPTKIKISILDKWFSKHEAERKKNQNHIKTLKNVVLDPTDGDFSLDINGKSHLWIDNESVIVLADFIESKLKEIR